MGSTCWTTLFSKMASWRLALKRATKGALTLMLIQHRSHRLCRHRLCHSLKMHDRHRHHRRHCQRKELRHWAAGGPPCMLSSFLVASSSSTAIAIRIWWRGAIILPTESVKKTRTVTAPARRTRANRGQGRPVGYLVAWLAKGETARTKADHWGADGEAELDERIFARGIFKGLDTADSRGILEAEKAVSEGDMSEPEEVVH